MIKARMNFQSTLILLLVIFPTLILFLTPYYVAALLVSPLILIAIVLSSNRNDINVFFYMIIFLIPFGEYRKIGPLNIPWLLALAVFGQVFF